MKLSVLPSVTLLLAIAPQGLAAGQQPQVVVADERKTMVAVRLSDSETIQLDGQLDEDVWARAIPAADFMQQDPDNGTPATERTEVRILYTADALYMGVTCFDSEPDRWLGYQRRRDELLGADDRFMWTIDTYLDARTAYYFEMNPSGLMADELQGVGNVRNRQWDGIWTARARRSEIGWTLEIEIPFRTLNFNPSSDTWGINFQRTVRRKNEESVWTGWPRNQGLRRMTNAGLLTGIRDVTQGVGLDIKPYAVATSQSSPGRGDSTSRSDGNVGVDLFYNPTPGLRANLTVNTDFAQAEVDQRQVNLTRFSLFFPEKRDFFLDGSTFFDFASGSGDDVTPFFSRRIGLDDRGTPQKIDFGAKLTGQLGDHDIGVLHVQTGHEDASPGRRPVAVAGEDFTVLRVKRRMFRQSYVGGIYTRRAARGVSAPTRDSLGLDFNLATASFLGEQNLTLTGFLVQSRSPLVTGKDKAFGLHVIFPNDPLTAELRYREVQDNHDDAIGFTPRTGYRRFNPEVGFSARPRQSRWVRRYLVGGEVTWFLDADDNRTLTRETSITAFQVDLHSQDTIQVNVLPTYELLEEPFSISRGITLPVGNDYSFTRYRVRVQTASRRVVAVVPTVEWGGFYSGDRLRTSLDVNIRARPGVIAYLSAEWNRVELGEGTFHTRLYRAIGETQFSPWMALVNNVQYDTQSAVLGWQSRFRWILKPGSDLYLVYTHNWLDDPLQSRFKTLDRRAASKVLYTHRF